MNVLNILKNIFKLKNLDVFALLLTNSLICQVEAKMDFDKEPTRYFVKFDNKKIYLKNNVASKEQLEELYKLTEKKY